MSLTKLPIGLPGQLYRSPMPLSPLDPGGSLLAEYKDSGIDLVVMLAGDEEAQRRTGHDLRQRYAQEGLDVLQFPIPDFGVPEDIEGLAAALEEVITQASSGKNLAIHCYAGLGRTGMFAALLAKRILQLSGEEALAWVRRHIPGAVETPEQIQLIHTL